jgi:hypothetical protein
MVTGAPPPLLRDRKLDLDEDKSQRHEPPRSGVLHQDWHPECNAAQTGGASALSSVWLASSSTSPRPGSRPALAAGVTDPLDSSSWIDMRTAARSGGAGPAASARAERGKHRHAITSRCGGETARTHVTEPAPEVLIPRPEIGKSG